MTIKRQKRKFDPGFKRQIVAQIESNEMTLSEAARLHDLSPTVINYWRKQYSQGALVDGPSPREKQLERDNERLLAQIGRLTMEVENLKKLDRWKQNQKKHNSSVITGLDLIRPKKGVDK
jgi:transposase-like protein